MSDNQQLLLVLSHVELQAITGRNRYRAQARILARLGITYRLRPDGFPLVSRAHFEAIMGPDTPSPDRKAEEPNWSALDAA